MHVWIDLIDRINPLMRREMRRVARMGRNYLLLLVLPVLLLLAVLNQLGTAPGHPSLHLLNIFVTTAYYLAVFAMPALAASAVAFERESGSLDMLRTAGLGGGRIISGKGNGLVLLFALILVTGLPIVALAMTFGGIAGKDLAALYFVALFAGVRAAAFGFLGYGITGGTAMGSVLAYVLLFGWMWGVDSFTLWLPEYAPYEMLLEPRAAMQVFVEAGELPAVMLAGEARPFWWVSILLMVLQALGCILLAAPLVVAGGNASSQGAGRSVARLTRWRRFRREHLVPDQCNIIFERDFRSGLFNGSWILWALWPVLLVPALYALCVAVPVAVEILRIAVGIPLLMLVAIRSATTINRMRASTVITQVFMTNVSPRGMIQGKILYILVTTLPWIFAVWVVDTILLYPSQLTGLPVHQIASKFMDIAVHAPAGEWGAKILAGTVAYGTTVVYVFVVVNLGLRFSVQNDNSTVAVTHTLGWGALLVAVANTVLVLAATGFIAVLSLLTGLLTQRTLPGALFINMIPSLLFFLLWASYLVKWGFGQMKEATRNMERSLKTDEFGAPPSLFDLGEAEQFEVETWGQEENPYY